MPIINYICTMNSPPTRAQKLSGNYLNQLLGLKNEPHSRKAIPKPTAQSTTLCAPELKYLAVENNIIGAISKTAINNPFLNLILTAQYYYGLRISEILNIRHSDLMKGYKVLIRGKKGSENRIIVLPELFNRFKPNKDNHQLLFECFSRFYVYREYNKLGLSINFATSTKRAITHSLRHIAIQNLKSNNISTHDIKLFIGHKNEKSTTHYTNKS